MRWVCAGLNLLSQWLGKRRDNHRDHHPRRKVLPGISAVLSLNHAAFWIFVLTVWGLLMVPNTGSVAGSISGSLLDALYLCAGTYTRVGLGELAPGGTMALTGLVLITWSASFTVL